MTAESERPRTFTEEIEVAGGQLIDQIKRLVAEGNVRQLRIRDADGDVFLETPLTVGALAGSAIVLAAPWLAMLGVLAALATRVKVEVVREAATTDTGSAEPADPAAGKAASPETLLSGGENWDKNAA